MQPYFFPYIGYYQLVFSAENFVFLDDANYIKQGYINRNSILLNCKVQNFSLPVSGISSFRKINEHAYIDNFSKFLKMIELAYKKSPFFDQAMPIIEEVSLDKSLNVAEKNAKSVMAVLSYLNCDRDFTYSSEIDIDRKKKGQERVIDICKKIGISKYRNSIGGKTIYDHNIFKSENIELKFIKSINDPYSQGTPEFIANLSIIDQLMHCDKEKIIRNLNTYELIN